jgi:HlyD family secretion protein
VCSLESETLEDNFKDAKASLDDAQLSFDNTREKLDDYTIEAPITGTVIEKYSKVGDTLGMSSQGQNMMAIIYDLSYLKFDMALDELDISKVAVGQKVMISCEAINLSGIEGEISKVSVVGSTSYNSTSYPVTVKIYNPPKGLLAGMNVDAELIIEESENALAIPSAAVQRGGVVYIKDDGSKAEDDRAPEGYMSVRVKTGISSDNYIEITEGELKEGDIIYVPQAVHVTTNVFEQMMSGNMPNMGTGMPNMGASRPSGNMGGMSGSRPSGNMGGGMR